jgi:hypothetical protein
VLALVGVGMLGYALLTLFNSPSGGATPTSLAQNNVPTAAIIIPTVTAAPPTAAPTQAPAPTDTLAAPAATDTPPQPTGPVLNILVPANVRSGPGINYPVVGGVQAGSTQTAVGRDGSAQWYVIDYLGGQGWVSNQVSAYTGDTNALPVIQAPPPPAPTATPVPPAPPPTSTPATGSSRGVRGDYWALESSARVYAVNQDIWFRFKITNTTGSAIPYRCLGAKVLGGAQAQCSWGNGSNDALTPNQVLEWNDHINIGAPGTYTLVLGICYLGSTSECRASASAGWEILSAGIQVTIQ